MVLLPEEEESTREDLAVGAEFKGLDFLFEEARGIFSIFLLCNDEIIVRNLLLH